MELPLSWERLKGKTLYLSGASGLIVSSIADIIFWINKNLNMQIRLLLAGRNKSRIEKRFRPFVEGQDYQFVFYDALKEEKPDVRADYIIHGASNADPYKFSTQPVETMLGNIIGLKTLFELGICAGSERILYISSGEIYGKRELSNIYHEEDYGYINILNQRACYPIAKRASETLCIAYQSEYHIDTVIARPCHVYGPSLTNHDSRASAQFIRSACEERDVVMKSEGNQLRSYCYSLDCASAILTVLLNGETGQAYNIADIKSVVSIREFAEIVAQKASVQIQFEKCSEVERRSYNLMENSVLDSSKLLELGWKARTSIVEGIEKTISIRKCIL